MKPEIIILANHNGRALMKQTSNLSALAKFKRDLHNNVMEEGIRIANAPCKIPEGRFSGLLIIDGGRV